MRLIENLARGGIPAFFAALPFLAVPLLAQQENGGNGLVDLDALPMSVMEAGAWTGAVSIDGRLDEPAWSAAPVRSAFIQSEPDEGAPAGRDTQVRFLIDDDAIYVSARLFEDPADIRRLLVRRDQRGRNFDWFGVSMDPNHDRRTGYAFRVTAAGVQQDLYMFDDSGEDTNWDAVWESAVTTDDEGWTVELRIPISQIRYESGPEPQTWGINFHRRRSAAGELSHFSLESKRRTGLVSQFGEIRIVRVPSSSQRIEARPYVVSSYHDGPAEDGDPFFDGSAAGARLGSDFRLGLGSAFTLDATVNPDFGQVEADPAEINLTAFETFFDERRPFFVEDAQVFDFRLSGGPNQLFYSRRIGRPPHGEAPDEAEFANMPEAATILGAAKITGRTAGGLSLGVLTAVTQAESGEARFEDGSFGDFGVEPRTEYGVATAHQDFNGGASQVRGIVTALHRGLPSSGEFDFLPDQAYSAGVRFEHQWSNRLWRLEGFFAGSHVRGSPGAITRLQRASNHYFQRPDGTRASVDSTATSLAGAEWRLQLERQNDDHWNGAVWLAEVTKGFEINDLGFSGSRERLDGGVRVGYRETQPGRVFRDYDIFFFTFNNFSHEALDDVGSWDSWRRAYTNGTFNLGARFTLLNYHGANVNFSWQPDRYSRRATRGGPVMLEPGGTGVRLGINSDRRRTFNVNGNVEYDRGSLGSGDKVEIEARVGFRPSSQVEIFLEPGFEVERDGSQYVFATSTPSYEPTLGRSYVFGELDRKTFTLESRVNYTFSPKLSFQLYAQTLLSSGDYLSYRQLERAGSYEFREFQEGDPVLIGGETVCAAGSICRDADGTQHVDLDGNGLTDYSFGDEDFNVRSFIGNAVLRWEYRPGSTIFLVWQRAQRGDARVGDFDFGRDLDGLWGAPADNRFLVKVNYWLGL